MAPSRNVRLVLALVLTAAASPALAQAGPLSLGMSCGAARQLVASRGAAVISTGRFTYDRYVASSLACARGETTEPAWIPTADTSQCFVGYRCREIDLEPPGR